MYAETTNLCGIPYRSKNEDEDIEENINIIKIIDSLLYAGTCGVTKALFEDGDYDIFSNGDGTFTLIIQPYGNYSLLGILNNRLFYSTETLVFDNIVLNKNYFLYVGTTIAMDTDPTKFSKILSSSKKNESKSSILLATITFKDNKPIIDEDPDDKIYSKDILAHSHDISNPHGRKLHQDKLFIADNLFVRGNEIYKKIYVEGKIPFDDITLDTDIMFVNSMMFNNKKIWFEIDKNKLSVNGEKNAKFKLEISVK